MVDDLASKRVRGTVCDDDGAALAGACVTATRDGASIVSITGEDGSYELELPPYPHVLEATHDGYCSVRLTIDVSIGDWKPNFLLARTCALRGVVVDRTGVGVPRAQVTIDGKVRTTVACDDKGAFEVRGARLGATAIRARAPGLASREATKVDVVLGASVADVEVVVDRTFSIRGRMVDRSQPPQGIEGASIRFSSMAVQRSYTTDSEGRFQIDDLIPGEYTVKATKRGTIFEDTNVSIRDADVEVEIGQRAIETVAGNASPPEMFQRLEFRAARQRALAEGKLLLVDATAEWCGPCKMMDRTTWVDSDVVAWVRDHAIALQIDVEADRGFAQELRITAMPTIIAFVDGAEFDRVVGAKKPKELLAWLDAVTRGETSLVIRRQQVQKNPGNIDARLDLARELTRAGRYEEAVAEHVWLWEHMLEYVPSMYGVRNSFFARDLMTLVNAHEPARATISAVRDRAAPPDTGPIAVEIFRDWVCLNRVLGEAERSLAWFDALSAARRADLASSIIEHDIIPLLVEKARWADAGALYGNPLATLDRAAQILSRTEEMATKRDLPELIASSRSHFRKSAANLIRSLRAAGRDTDANSVERRAREVDPSEEMIAEIAALS